MILVTGASGKVGRAFIERILGGTAAAGQRGIRVRALCHRRDLSPADGLEVVRGSVADRDVVRRAVEGVTHVVHLATCKETPDAVMDVTVKGLFWLLEECRLAPPETFRRFLLVGGDAAVGHFFYPHPAPVTEASPHTAYPGCYALSKVLEEVMVAQYGVQYGLDWCCLRAPWIMEKDDFRYSLSFGEDVFGGPRWRDLVGADEADRHAVAGTIPVMLDPRGRPVKRNFIHVDDLVEAMVLALDHPRARQELFNIAMDEPVDYRMVAEHLARTRGLPSVDIPTPYHSTWLDNAKARLILGWAPEVDLEALIERAWTHERAPDDPRVVWYPG